MGTTTSKSEVSYLTDKCKEYFANAWSTLPPPQLSATLLDLGIDVRTDWVHICVLQAAAQLLHTLELSTRSVMRMMCSQETNEDEAVAELLLAIHLCGSTGH